jgi:pyridoxamine 5'-phosphate oxidase
VSRERSLAALREEYRKEVLSERDVAPEPVSQFGRWFQEALDAAIPEPNAMVLSTVSADGHPSARVLLLKGFDAAGFTFFTNYESRKGADLAINPYAAMTFLWLPLERQVRVEGRVGRLGGEIADAYFKTRPRGSQIGAWASAQSQVLRDREELEARFREADRRFEGTEVPRPAHWGGYLLSPECVEFWQGRPSRLHDRLRYRRSAGVWLVERLAP